MPSQGEIIVVTYNHSKYIRQALASIEKQECSFSFKVKIYDDHSTDDTLKIIEEYRVQSKLDIELVPTSKNLGINSNYVRAFSQAEGEWLAILEGDDYWNDPHHLQTSVEILMRQPEISGTFSSLIVYYEKQNIFIHRQYKSDKLLYSAADLARENIIGNFSSCVYRNSSIKDAIPSFQELNGYDWSLNLILSDRAPLHLNLGSKTVYRVHSSGQWSSLHQRDKLRQTREVIQLYDKFFNHAYSAHFKAQERALKWGNFLYRYGQFLRFGAKIVRKFGLKTPREIAAAKQRRRISSDLGR
jgi:glycosyltransferase involved in cell wall biosynthesis